MKRALLLTVVALGFLVAPAAHAQTGPKAKFYDFPALTIDGTTKAPAALFHSPRERVRFERLLKLKRSFLGTLQESGSDLSLK
jgi:hypothetical protein